MCEGSKRAPLVLAQELPGEGKGALIRGPFFWPWPDRLHATLPSEGACPRTGGWAELSGAHMWHAVPHGTPSLAKKGPKRAQKGAQKGLKRAPKGTPWELPGSSLGHHVWPGSSHEHHRRSQEPPMAPHGSPGASQRLPRGPKRAPWELPGSSLGSQGEALGSQGESLGTFPGRPM